ncbi:septal ring lytic transglycosylase RlpA family protein [Aeromonas veronii]|uniref:septal ring lytic transglycosylase RlpA family protein n=1 Tax=Aeromonas veronii TaxID=654 RepID=UPI0015D01513|nr:septal ring lytic transglycosylase RlpA family protein [Aeromonas veronii]MBE8734214.1 septal ring lytic transglycosylase RlpA family protein [Aeromonas veronii]MBE8738090.1 septal ring lytic transglycosylase RlpA family protein [Aeromonas veronii]MBE8743345.1 septal ring lytic transglycosylase RlpA family protein [Aeromonas veronii]MBE8764561.1 septal ring lytic transglycosylase RlpA family protein [Aeromonas veronii]MBE8838891.1 septal ring lytic transglycosylase RlpA family protein [Aero
MHLRHKLLPLSLSLLLAACSSQPEQSAPVEPQAPVSKPPVIEIPQATGAIPRPEPLSASGNRDYWIGKQKHEVWRDIKHYSEEGTASWLSPDLDGQKTANGDVLDSKLFSAAHRNLPIPSYVRVTNLDNGLETIVRVNDRGPFNSPRLIDLSYAAAKQLEMVDSGEARVRLELISDTPDQMVIMEPMKPIEMTPTTPAAASNTLSQDGFLGEPTALAMATPAAEPAPVKAPAAKPAKAVPVKAVPAKAAAPASSGDGKMIQVLASGSRDRAEAMGKVMTQRYGVPYRIDAHGAIFRVLIGPVAADQQASVLEKVRQGGLEQAFIVP